MTDAGFNAAAWLVDRIAQERGDHPAVETPTQTLTYSELVDLTGRAAAGLRSLGLRRDDRVVFVANDDIALFAGILGAIRGGFVAVPVSTMYGPDELAEIIADSGAVALVASSTFAEPAARAAARCPELRHVVWDGDPGAVAAEVGAAQQMTWEELVARGAGADPAEHAPVPAGPDAWALWLYTSGTTGKPKGAMHRHDNLRIVTETYGAQVLGITPEDRCLSVAKLFFAYGIGNSMFFPLSVGATSVLNPERPTPAGIAERIATGRPTLFFGVPTFYAGLLSSDIPDDTFAGVRLGASAGEPLPRGVQERMLSRFGLEILDGIGSTECLHIFLSNRPGEIKPGTTGKAVPGYDLEIRDLDGSPVPDGEPGTLFVRGGSAALGYWRRAQATRTVFQGEWLNTGDTYVRDSEGYYACMGRSTDLLKAGGIWVSPTEVEDRLLAHDAVAECAVVGQEDADGLVKPVAVVVPRGPVTAADLDTWCREGLAPFKRPRHVYFVDELPKTATGKMQRFKVRALVKDLAAMEAVS
ncbi:benzoate-CoA ligase family protein [Janibacter sp. FSL W8-0316]|uniref:benzoate-CoA ligase family protein n=1 Tax=Janibacter sp. FSL W8-0316 TaxID=2975325 RepID=UPI0030FC6672